MVVVGAIAAFLRFKKSPTSMEEATLLAERLQGLGIFRGWGDEERLFALVGGGDNTSA